jgi:hypothetical protein
MGETRGGPLGIWNRSRCATWNRTRDGEEEKRRGEGKRGWGERREKKEGKEERDEKITERRGANRGRRKDAKKANDSQ